MRAKLIRSFSSLDSRCYSQQNLRGQLRTVIPTDVKMGLRSIRLHQHGLGIRWELSAKPPLPRLVAEQGLVKGSPVKIRPQDGGKVLLSVGHLPE